MMYKNAGIKSKREAVQRLINGEEFVITSGGSVVARFKFCENEINPLQWFDGWLHYEVWETEVEWYDNIGEGVLCWVWDFDEKTKSIAIVTEYHEDASYPYLATRGWVWGNAVPVKPGEIDKFVSKHG